LKVAQFSNKYQNLKIKLFEKGGIGPNIEQGSCKVRGRSWLPAMAPTVLSLLLIIL